MNPHAPYIRAVVDAFPADIAPTDFWCSDAETGEDGRTCTLSALLSWDDEAAPDVFPFGVILLWDLENDWQYAAMRSRSENEWPLELPLSLWAAPEDVVATVQALLAGRKPPAVSLPEWRDDAVLAAVREWEGS